MDKEIINKFLIFIEYNLIKTKIYIKCEFF